MFSHLYCKLSADAQFPIFCLSNTFFSLRVIISEKSLRITKNELSNMAPFWTLFSPCETHWKSSRKLSPAKKCSISVIRRANWIILGSCNAHLCVNCKWCSFSIGGRFSWSAEGFQRFFGFLPVQQAVTKKVDRSVSRRHGEVDRHDRSRPHGMCLH